MGCIGCSCSTGKDAVAGCRTNGGCASGGCNRHNTYDWITAAGITDARPFDIVEVSFKNGSRKEFFKNPPFTRTITGDWVVVESATGGFDVGKISLSGELVRLQMKRKRIRPDARLQQVVRKAHERDLERLDEVRQQEREVMIRSRAIARTLDLNMKVGDVEFQGDGRKCTFYYTADGRVDFRELIRHYAREFKVKIEMRQIGARQESARIGGLGNCGRELCCSTWLAEFKSVNTAAARYQNLAINQTKLSGMCGRLKCCLNYELDTYIDALEDFPDRAEKLRTAAGLAILIKTDVFKRLMYYTYAENRGKLVILHVDQVWDALDMIKRGEMPGSLEDILAMAPPPDEVEDDEPDFESVDNVIQLPVEKRKKKKKKKKTARAGQSVAAAVEKEDRQAVGNPAQRSGGGPQRPRDKGGNRPSNDQRQQQKPPQGKGGGNRPPENRPDQQRNDQRQQRPPENRTENRPPEQRQQQPRPPESKPPQSTEQGEDKNRDNNRRRDKRRFKGKGPNKKD
ncbi:MAG: regulatory iron-sulfur-containing complex subunit RicT [Saprospiraceae bacterium]